MEICFWLLIPKIIQWVLHKISEGKVGSVPVRTRSNSRTTKCTINALSKLGSNGWKYTMTTVSTIHKTLVPLLQPLSVMIEYINTQCTNVMSVDKRHRRKKSQKVNKRKSQRNFRTRNITSKSRKTRLQTGREVLGSTCTLEMQKISREYNIERIRNLMVDQLYVLTAPTAPTAPNIQTKACSIPIAFLS